MVEDYSEINGRKVSGKGFEVIEAVVAYGITAATEVVASLTGKTLDTKVDERITPKEFDNYKKPGLRQNRLLFIVDRIPMLDKFEDKEAIYVNFPMGAYVAKSNYPFISPCYEIKNIYYIRARRFVWADGGQVPIRLEPDKILEQLVKLNNIKRTIDNRGKGRRRKE
jgi:hypothetical protein